MARRVRTGAPEPEDGVIEKGKSYRPIEGDVSGEVVDIQDNKVHWRHKDTVFLIPVERFTEYFCEDTSGGQDSSGADRADTGLDTLR